jgi:hypothetical protein
MNLFLMRFLPSVSSNLLRCDNFLLEPFDKNCSEDEVTHQRSETPSFWVHVADFGEAKVWTTEEEAYALLAIVPSALFSLLSRRCPSFEISSVRNPSCLSLISVLRSYTFRNRGTEFTKSPEMLQVAYASQKTRATYDRRKHVSYCSLDSFRCLSTVCPVVSVELKGLSGGRFCCVRCLESRLLAVTNAPSLHLAWLFASCLACSGLVSLSLSLSLSLSYVAECTPR